MRQSWETMTSVSAGHMILTPTQPVGSGRPQRESNHEKALKTGIQVKTGGCPSYIIERGTEGGGGLGGGG